MKKIILTSLAFFFTILISLAQKNSKDKNSSVPDVVDNQIKITSTTSKDGKAKVRIEKSINGKTTITEKTINDGDVFSYNDSTNNVTVSKEFNENQEDEPQDDLDSMEKDAMRYHYQQRNMRKNGVEDYNPNMGYRFRPNNLYSHPLTTDNNLYIKDLEVYTNKPLSDVINVKFFAPQKGDISITVSNLEGEVVAKYIEKDFSGEFLNQIKLKSGLKGVFFVVVAQNQDGISRKIKIN